MSCAESFQRAVAPRRRAGAAAPHFAGLLLLSLGPLACTNQKPIVPEKNQKQSEELYGEQQSSMQSLNQTGSEQAAAAHENAVRPVVPDSER